MEYKFVSTANNFNIEDFKSDLKLIETSETFIWELHKSGRIIDLFDAVKKRESKIKDLVFIYNDSNKRFDKIQEKIKLEFPEVESVNFKSHFEKITILITNLEKLVENQINELNISDNLIYAVKRVNVLNGNKKRDSESEFTTIVKEIIDIIENNKSEYMANNDINVESNLEEITDIIDEKVEESVVVCDVAENPSEILEEVVIETETPITKNELDNSVVSITITTDDYNDNTSVADSSAFEEFFEDDSTIDTAINDIEMKKVDVETFEVNDDIQKNVEEVDEENNLFEIKPEEENTKSEILEPSYEELIEIIKDNFCYLDSSEINNEEKSQILKNAIESKSALKYARVLWNLKNDEKIDELKSVAQKIYGNTLTDLYNYEIGISPYSSSQSWVNWDVAKQIYYYEHPSMSDKTKYRIADPLVDEEKQNEILDRRIGWEIYSKLTTGELDSFLSKFQDPIYRKRMVDFMIEKPNKLNTLSSYKLADLGKNVRMGFVNINNS